MLWASGLFVVVCIGTTQAIWWGTTTETENCGTIAGEYYASAEFGGTPCVRNDAKLDQNASRCSGDARACTICGPSSVRWQGYMKSPRESGGLFTFSFNLNGTITFWISNVMVFSDTGAGELYNFEFGMLGGRYYPVRIEYRSPADGTPGSLLTHFDIPSTSWCSRPATSACLSTLTDGLVYHLDGSTGLDAGPYTVPSSNEDPANVACNQTVGGVSGVCTTTSTGYILLDSESVGFLPANFPLYRAPRSACAWGYLREYGAGNQNKWLFSYGQAVQDSALLLGMEDNTNEHRIGVVGWSSDVLAPPFSWQLETWTHVCGVYNGTTATLFVDGALNVTESKTWSISDTDLQAAVGAAFYSDTEGDQVWPGSFYDVKLWSRALSDSEIAQLYASTRRNASLYAACSRLDAPVTPATATPRYGTSGLYAATTSGPGAVQDVGGPDQQPWLEELQQCSAEDFAINYMNRTLFRVSRDTGTCWCRSFSTPGSVTASVLNVTQLTTETLVVSGNMAVDTLNITGRLFVNETDVEAQLDYLERLLVNQSALIAEQEAMIANQTTLLNSLLQNCTQAQTTGMQTTGLPTV